MMAYCVSYDINWETESPKGKLAEKEWLCIMSHFTEHTVNTRFQIRFSLFEDTYKQQNKSELPQVSIQFPQSKSKQIDISWRFLL